MSVTDDRQTDDRQTVGRAIAYSEREPEFTFAKNCEERLRTDGREEEGKLKRAGCRKRSKGMRAKGWKANAVKARRTECMGTGTEVTFLPVELY